MHAEIVTTGSELLLGQLVDTNSAFIARTLRDIGLNLFFKTTVGDNEERLVEALRIAMSRSDIIITTGGLGPTVDDVTRPAIARATGRELEFRPELLTQIEARFQRFGAPMSENNRRQAYVPGGAIVIENPVGTAPSFIVEHMRGIVISLPGVPSEMEYLLTHNVAPYLRDKLELKDMILTRTLHAVGLGESRIDAAIADLQTSNNPTVGLSAHPGQTDIRIAAKAANEAAARALIAPVEAQIRERLTAYVCCADEETIESRVLCQLAKRGWTLTSIESGTGGQLAGRLAGAAQPPSAFLNGRIVSALDRPVEDAANALRAESGATLALAAQATWSGERQIDMAVALAAPEGIKTVGRGFSGARKLGAEWAANSALGLVWRYLQGE